MLRNSKNLEGCCIGDTDGTIGEVKDLYFDDEAWVTWVPDVKRDAGVART